ncbi:MAG: hypothetical protein K6U03_11355 [Firmicutes bacterium]|nr:hypothetical protein [Bacillota bacterium]
MDLFQKCEEFTAAREAMAAGIYPYFHELQSGQDTEVIIDRKKVIMVGSNNYLGLSNHPEVVREGIEGLQRYGAGTASVRFICGTFAAGAAGAGMDLAWIAYISRLSGRHIPSYSGIYLTLVGVRGILAPLLGAIASKKIGLDAVLALSFSFTILSWIPFVLLFRWGKRR